MENIQLNNKQIMAKKGWNNNTVLLLDYNKKSYKVFTDIRAVHVWYIHQLLGISKEKINSNYFMFDIREIELLIDSQYMQIVELRDQEELDIKKIITEFKNVYKK